MEQGSSFLGGIIIWILRKGCSLIIKSQYKQKCKVFKFNYTSLQSKYNHLLMTFHCAIFSRNRSSLENSHKSKVTISKLLIYPPCWNRSLTVTCAKPTQRYCSTMHLAHHGSREEWGCESTGSRAGPRMDCSFHHSLALWI